MLFVLCLLGMAPLFASCEKEASYEGYPEMYDYYVESCGLGDDAVDTDSITRFSRKVDAFVDVNPDAKDTSYYPLIQSNIKKYSVTIVITIEDGKALLAIDPDQPTRILSTDKKALKAGGLCLALMGVPVKPTDDVDVDKEYQLIPLDSL